jgi:hypothetical protein
VSAARLVLCALALAFVALPLVAGEAQAWVHQECDVGDYPACCDTGPGHLPVGFGSHGNTVCTPRVD